MPLDFQTISIPFGRGIDTKQDEKLVEEGTLVLLENGVFRKGGPKGGTIEKRPGTSSLNRTVFGSGTPISSGDALSTYDNELLLFGSSVVYSRTSSLEAWVNKGTFATLSIANEFIIKNQFTQSNPDMATNTGITGYVWSDDRGGIRGSIIDETTGTILVNDTQISATGSRPRIIAAGTLLIVLFLDGANLKMSLVNIGNPSFGATTNARTDANTTNIHFDCIVVNTHIVVAYSRTGPTIGLFYISNTGAVSPVTLPTAINIAETAVNCLGISKRNNDTEIYVAYHNATNGVRVFARTASFVQIFAPTTLENDTTNVFRQITGVNSGLVANTQAFFYERTSTNTQNTVTRYNTMTNAGVAGTAADFKRSVGVGGKAFEKSNKSYVLLASQSDEQSCFFLADESGKILSQTLYGDGGGLRTVSSLPQAVAMSSTTCTYALSRAIQLVGEGNKSFTVNGVNRTDFTFGTLPNTKDLQLGGNLHIPSGSLFIYDGANFVESGFYFYPEGLKVDDNRFRVTKVDGSAGTPEISFVQFLHGDKIVGGQYWILTSAVPTDYYVWYTKDGVGTDPAPVGRTAIAVAILSTDDAEGVATKTKTALDAVAGTPFITTRNNFTLTITNAANNNVTDTANVDIGLGGHFVATTVEGAGGTAEVTVITCTVGTAYVTGEYMFINSASDAREYVLWINKDSGGGKPQITGKILIEIAIGAASTATQVGDAFAAALNPLSDFTATNAGGVVTVTNVANGVTTNAKNVTMATTTTGALADGTYGVAVIYQWEDVKGQKHRSAPFFGTAEVNGELNRGKITLEIPTLRITNKSNVICVCFRTEANGTVFYRVSSFSSPVRNSTTVDKVIFTSLLNDSEIINREFLYTTGGVLENIVPVSPQLATIHNNRLFLKGDQDNQLWYSKECIPGEAVAFNDSFTLDIDPSGGPITALGSIDNYLVIFKESQIRVIAGAGPNAAGLQNDFTDDQLVTSDVGCITPKSIVRFDKGILFKSNKGLYLIDRSLQASYLGAPVEDFNSLDMTSAALLADVNEIRFTNSDGVALVYNYFFNEWSTFTNYQAVDAILWQNVYHHLKPDGTVRGEDTTMFQDSGSAVILKLRTAWIKLGQLQGFKRLRRVAILGDYKSSHSFVVDIAYDYQPVISDTILWSPDSVINTSLYGDDSPYGSGDPYGGDADTVYQFRFHHPRQKMESVQYTLQDSLSGTYGESYSLSDLSLEVAMKRGINKMRAGKTL